MFLKETLRLIKSTYKRFIALVLMTFIGVSFMMGLMSCKRIMIESVDAFYDESKFQDIQLVSQFGFCNEDIAAISKLDCVEYLFASKYQDTFAKVNNQDNEFVLRFYEMDSMVNNFELQEGRLPEKFNEILYCPIGTRNSNIKIGDIITIYLKDGEIKEHLQSAHYKVVGIVSSPEHIANFSTTSNLNNLDLNGVCYGLNDIFLNEYYTSVYLTINNAIDKLSFYSKYEKIIDNAKSEIEELASEQVDFHRTNLLSKYQEELDKNKEEFEAQKKEGQEKLDEAKNALEEAQIKIVSLETDLELADYMLEEAQGKIDNISYKIYNLNKDFNEKATDLSEKTGYDLVNNFDENLPKVIDNRNYTEEITDLVMLKAQIEAYTTLRDSSNSLMYNAQNQISEYETQIEEGRKEYAEGLKEYNEAVSTFNEEIESAELSLRKAQQDLDDLPDAKWYILDRNMQYSSAMFIASSDQMGVIGFSVPLLFYLVAALVSLTTMTRLIDEQRLQLGTYRALGFTQKEIITKYLVYALLASSIGSISGVIVGLPLFPAIIYTCWRLMYKLPPMKLVCPLGPLVGSILSFTLLMALVTIFVVAKNLRDNPAALLRPVAPKTGKQTFLEKITFIWKRLSFTSKVTARNLIRYKTRFFMTVIGVAGCTSLLVVGFGIKDSVSSVITRQYETILKYRQVINLENDNDLDEIIENLSTNEANEDITPFVSYTSKAYLEDENKTINLQVFNKNNGVLNLLHTDNKTVLNLDDNGVIITQKFALNENIKKGDYLTIESKNGIKASVYVKDICEWHFEHYIFMSDKYYEAIFAEPVEFNAIALNTSDIDNLKEEMSIYDNFISITDHSNTINNFNNMISALNLIVVVVILVAGALAFVVLINLINVNISERLREIATLKVLGFNNKEVYSYIFKEIIILTLIGAIIGLPMGKVEENIIMTVINMENIYFSYTIKPFTYIASFSITILFTIIVMLLTRKSLRNIKMVESLKSVE